MKVEYLIRIVCPYCERGFIEDLEGSTTTRVYKAVTCKYDDCNRSFVASITLQDPIVETYTIEKTNRYYCEECCAQIEGKPNILLLPDDLNDNQEVFLCDKCYGNFGK